MDEPRAERPDLPASYGVPDVTDGMEDWATAIARLEPARNYWVGTVRPDGRPHAVPVWGVLVDGVLYHGGGGDTRKARNLAANPAMVVHTESGDEVVIVEGVAKRMDAGVADAGLLEHIDDAYEAKYGMRHGTPVWALRPTVAFAWSTYPATMTRFRFPAGT